MIGNRVRRALRLAVALALLLPAPAAFAYTAHYLVVTENSSTGELAVVHHQLVELAGSPEGSPTRPRRSALESRLQARVLDKVSGNARFETMVTGSPFLRGEFRGADGIDGRIVPVAERQYVVRVPAGPSALLELQGLDSDAASPIAVASDNGPRLVIDLDAAKSITGPIAPAERPPSPAAVPATATSRPEATLVAEPACSSTQQQSERYP